ncbi:MAG: hypothetical protein WAU36_08720 [Cyclobacteriaceae bacterium]
MVSTINTFAQNKVEVDGQLIGLGTYNARNDAYGLVAGRYLPELKYNTTFDSTKNFSIEGSANIFGSATFFKHLSTKTDGSIEPYRLWARYTSKQFELRIGLQKIDFGSATLLRPLQWFNQIDPRDPLQLTNGVYGALGRYYFLNNANIWLWSLYGNEKTRGLDAIKTFDRRPEYGGRIQHPVPKGEVAISYHHRTADASEVTGIPTLNKIPEDRYGLDGKWDIGIGTWFEASYIHKTQDVGIFTNQTLLNIGLDYTFGIGSGLNVVLEHLLTGFDQNTIAFTNKSNTTATMISYPLGLFDNLSTVCVYNWDANNFSITLNYQHHFKKMTGYVMAYYNPAQQQGIQENDLVDTVSGPGIRLMMVYNH